MPFSSLVYSIVTVLSGLFWWLGLLTNTEWQLFLIYCNFQVMTIGHLQCIPKTWCCLYKYKLLQTCQCWSWISITWFQIKNASNDSLWSYPVPLILLMLLQRKKKKTWNQRDAYSSTICWRGRNLTRYRANWRLLVCRRNSENVWIILRLLWSCRI